MVLNTIKRRDGVNYNRIDVTAAEISAHIRNDFIYNKMGFKYIL